MSRTMIVIIVSSLAVAIIVGVTLSIDHVVARSIERYGSEALGSEVSVGVVTIRLAEGRGRISGLRVAQPEGFGPGDALGFGEIVLDLDVASLAAGDPYVLELVRVADPVVFYVLRDDRSSNLDSLRQNLAGGSDTGADQGAGDTPPEASDAELRLRIDRLEIEGGRILADVKAVGMGEHEANLPGIRFDELGGKHGLPPEELATRIGGQFVAHSLASVTLSSVGDLVKRGERGLRGLLDKLLP